MLHRLACLLALPGLLLGVALAQSYPGLLPSGAVIENDGSQPGVGGPVSVPLTKSTTQTSNYTIAASDCFTTVVARNGSNTQFTVTLSAVTGFPSGCWVRVVNGDFARAKFLSGFPSSMVSVLFPTQAAEVQIINGAWATVSQPGRWRLPGNVTVYVDPTNGSNSNDCLASGSGACQTFAAAWATVQGFMDLNGKTVTIQGANTTYTSAITIVGPYPVGAPGAVVFDFGGGTIDNTSGYDLIFDLTGSGQFSTTFQNVTLKGAPNLAELLVNSGMISVGSGVTFGACTSFCYHMYADDYTAEIILTQNYTISGGAAIHYATTMGNITNGGRSLTVTLTGTPAFSSSFASAAQMGNIFVPNMTYSGSATGTRFLAWGNAVIETDTGAFSTTSSPSTCSASYFPGNSAGSVGNGGFCY